MNEKGLATSLNYYRSELKMRGVKRYKIIGILSELIYSFNIFYKNEEVAIFLDHVLGIKFKEYVYKSRTSVVARTSRIVFNYSDEELEIARKNLSNFINEIYNHKSVQNKNLSNKDFMIKWLKGNNK